MEEILHYLIIITFSENRNDTQLTRFQEDVTEFFPKDESKPEFISDLLENVETYFQK